MRSPRQQPDSIPFIEPFRFPDWPDVMPEVSEAVLQALGDGSWGKYDAQHSEQLITLIREMIGPTFVTPCSSGTVAVELALRGAGVQPGAEVILAAYDFPGNYRAIEAVGAFPVLVDVVENGWTIDPTQLDQAVNDRTAAVIASHLHGQMIDGQLAREWADKRGVILIEDACQVPGAAIAGRPVGSFGHLATLSFGGSKLLTAGRGGAVLTSSPDLEQRLRIYANRGNDAFPLSQLQAAALIPQLKRLSEQTLQRQSAAMILASELVGIPGLLGPKLDPASISAWYKFPLMVCRAEHSIHRDDYVVEFRRNQIPIDAGFRGFVRRSARRCRKTGPLVNAMRAAEDTLLLHHTALLLPQNELRRLATAIRDISQILVDRSKTPN